MSGCQPALTHSSYECDDIVEHPLQGPLKSKDELKALKKAAHLGNADAAFQLFAYYNIVEGNDSLRTRYLKLAVKLEHPQALFLAAVFEWRNKLHPDIEYAERMLMRAIELHCDDPNAIKLLEEIETAKETGIIPLETDFRSFGN